MLEIALLVSPVAAVAVLPIAIANGDVFGLSGKGWADTLLLTFLTGWRLWVAALGVTLVLGGRTRRR